MPEGLHFVAMIRRSLSPIVLLLLLAPAAACAAGVDHAALDRILRAHVKDGRVDYEAVRDREQAALKGYLDALAEVDPGALEQDEQLAFYINLYNATMIHTVVGRYRDDYSVSEEQFKVFKEPLVRVGGKTISLDTLEHGIVRKRFREPRIHAALVCAARSCPQLRSGAYAGQDLDSQLDEAMRQWVNDPSLNRVDPAARTMRVSEIFKWYAEDFGGPERIGAYVDRYHAADLSGYRVEYEPYDWSLNRQGRPRE